MNVLHRIRSFRLLFLSLCLTPLLFACSNGDGGPSSLDRSVVATGGAEALANLSTFSLSATGERRIFDEGFAPGDAPGSAGTFSLNLSYDVAGESLRLDYVRNSVGASRTLSEVVFGQLGFIDGQDANFSAPSVKAMTSDRRGSTVRLQRLLHPQLLLKEALADPSLVLEGGDGRIRLQDPVSPLVLSVDDASGLVSRLETMELDYNRRDVPLAVNFENWQMQEGVAFPLSLSIDLAGERIYEETRSNVAVNPPLAASLFALPAGVSPSFDAALADRGLRTSQYLQAFATLGFIKDGAHTEINAVQLSPGVFQLLDGANNSLVVEQQSGVVVLEAALHDLRARAILDWIAANIGKPVTHVVNSHFHVDHAGGTRLFIAAGATLVTHEAAAAFYLDMLSRTDTSLLPDALDQNPVAPVIQSVTAGGSVLIADALRPVEVFLLTSTHAADMVLPFVGNDNVVFVSDIFSPGGAAGAGAVELNTAIVNNGLNNPALIIAGGHGSAIGYADFLLLLP